MISIRAAVLSDLFDMDVQPIQSKFLSEEYLSAAKIPFICSQPLCFYNDEGILMVGDVTQVEGGYLAWVVLSQLAISNKRLMLKIVRAYQRILTLYKDDLVTFHIEKGHVEGSKMAHILGFHNTGETIQSSGTTFEVYSNHGI